MAFIDTAKIMAAAGNGGNGAVSFHREKYVATGGPDGGDGGHGGSVILTVDDHTSTLVDFRFHRKFKADSGENGSSNKKSGKRGADLFIKVPRGTVVRDLESGAVIRDMSDGEDFRLAKGGVGGWGNQHFATPTRQAPRFAKNGTSGETREVLLELKLLADVGLVGFPNVGKSTLLSVISAARPKIANYHFTTLEPNLGVVRVEDGESFVAADIPGIIEGAADGAGLGHDFLRHIDRCRLLIHVVDASGSEMRNPLEDIRAINEELKGWGETLASRPQIIAANKCDILDAESDNLSRLREYAAKNDLPIFEISAATQIGVRELVYKAAELLRALPPIEYYYPEYVEPEATPGDPADVEITVQDGVYFLEGAWLERICGGVNFSDYESRMWFERQLRSSGIFDRLEETGIGEGDTVSIYEIEFEYFK